MHVPWVLATTALVGRGPHGTRRPGIAEQRRRGNRGPPRADVACGPATIDAKGVGFKAFIPAVFARPVNEAFARRAGSEAAVKVTARWISSATARRCPMIGNSR